MENYFSEKKNCQKLFMELKYKQILIYLGFCY